MDPEPIEFGDDEAAEAYARRLKRIEDAIALKPTDRVPFYLTWRFWPARQAGMTCEQAMYDPPALSAATKAAVLEYQPDCFQVPHGNVAFGEALEILGFKALVWPGHGTDPDVSYQYLDKEYMSAAEYDEYLFDPSGFVIRKYLPRIAERACGLAQLPDTAGLFFMRLTSLARAFAEPEVAETIEALARAGEKARASANEAARFETEMRGLGFPSLAASKSGAPFDVISDYFRGSKGAMLDMFRNRDKLLEVLDKVTEIVTRNAIEEARGKTGNQVSIPLHWGLDGFMSPEQFNTFYWPQFRKMIGTLVDAGLVPYVFWEGDCGSRLETIADVPPGKCIYKFERTDLFRAKEVLGGIACLQGNVPASMLIAATPDEVDAYCRSLIETVGKDGGFILDGGTGVPEEARPENVAAMANAVCKYDPCR